MWPSAGYASFYPLDSQILDSFRRRQTLITLASDRSPLSQEIIPVIEP